MIGHKAGGMTAPAKLLRKFDTRSLLQMCEYTSAATELPRRGAAPVAQEYKSHNETSRSATLKATNWEFRNRATVFGLIFGVSFFWYASDHVNAAGALADRISQAFGVGGDLVLRIIIALAAVLVALCALVRTWASAYLRADIVYASDVKTATLVADGPYRRVRNPLYLGNILMAVGLGSVASTTGFFVLIAAMTIFCYRLVFREEAELSAEQGESYAAYLRAVPRFLMSPTAKIPSAGGAANWVAGFRAEAWCWSLVVGIIVFIVTLNLGAFFAGSVVALGAALVWNRVGRNA
jgi:protein-S-isoprenylcysteine O-methyltransferase Ste14